MALIKCPECGREISDQAEICIGCGFPIKKEHIDKNIKCSCCGTMNTQDADYCVKCHTRITPYVNTTSSQQQMNGNIKQCKYCKRYIPIYASKCDFCHKKQKSNPIIKIAGIFLGGFFLLAFLGSLTSSDDIEENNSENVNLEITTADTQEQQSNFISEIVETSESIETEIIEKKLSFSDYFDERIVDNIDNALSEVGLSNYEFIKKDDKLEIYYIKSNGYEISVMAYSDDGVYKIWIPNSSYTFYEDGEVLLTYSEMQDTIIDWSDRSKYYIMAKTEIKNQLKNPNSAKFPDDSEIGISRKGNIVAVSGYFDAKNSFDATVRTQFLLQMYVYDISTYSCELTYIQMDNEKVGEWIDMN